MAEDFEIGFINPVKGALLDLFLSKGWYRMGMHIFTTHSLQPQGDDNTYPVYWLRYNVRNVQLSKSSLAIIKLNKQFTVSYRPFSLTPELVELHRLYFSGIDFHAADSLENVLIDINRVVYDTWVIEIRDNGKLIAAGVFDLGLETIAGIINFYDHAYKKYSLGKYLVLLKYNFCVKKNLPWYYPGYFSTTYPKFDYKLFLDKAATDVFIKETSEWISYYDFVSIVK